MLSGGGLVAMVVFGLLRAGEQFRAQADLDARKDAQELARSLRAALAAPAALRYVSDAQRFDVRDGAPELPAEVGWLAPLPASPVDPVTAARWQAAQQAEFTAGDHGLAARCYDELLGEPGPGGDAALPLLAAAAWQAHRAAARERLTALLARLDSVLAAAVPARTAAAEFAAALASGALLHLELGGPLPAFAPPLLSALPPVQLAAVQRRLADRGVDTAPLAATAAAIAARRALLAEVARLLARGPRPGAQAAGAGTRLLLYYPAVDGAAAAGALVDAVDLLQAMDLPLRGEPPGGAPAPSAIGSVAPADAEEVVAGLWYVVPRPLPEPGLLGRPLAAAAAVATLALVFLGSGWLGFRALRREADAVRARADFLTVVTHELKTPLAAIRLLAEMLVEDRVPAGRHAEYYGLLAGEAARLSMLIENVLDLGRTERGERAYDLRPCDLTQVVREAAALFAPLCQRDGIVLDVAAPAAPAPALADRGALLQALLNVLDNARKYGARKHGPAGGAGGRIELHAEPRDGMLVVGVRDHGAGVPMAERESIFDRFVRGSAHRHGAVPGVGLGLHLARAIARRHGGELRCEAPADGGPGAQFAFTLPLQPGAEAAG